MKKWTIVITILLLLAGNITQVIFHKNEIDLRQNVENRLADAFGGQESLMALSNDELLAIITENSKGAKQIVVNKPVTIARIPSSNDKNGLLQKQIGKWTVIQPTTSQWQQIKNGEIKVTIENREFSVKAK